MNAPIQQPFSALTFETKRGVEESSGPLPKRTVLRIEVEHFEDFKPLEEFGPMLEMTINECSTRDHPVKVTKISE